MHITQTLKNLFSKTKAPFQKIDIENRVELERRSAVLDFSSKTMSRIASITLFCFLSQTFASVLWANPGLPKHHHFHESGYVGLHIVPEFDADKKVKGLRLHVSVSEKLYGGQNYQQPDLDGSGDQHLKPSVKQVCSTLLTPGAFGGDTSLLSQIPELSADISGIVDDSLKDLLLLTTETGDISITSGGNAKANRNLYISIMGGVTVQNLRAQGLCVQARSLDIQGNSNDITRLDYIKPDGKGETVMTLQKDASLHTQSMTLDRTTFKNYGTAVVKHMTGYQAVLHNHNTLNADILGNFQEFKNLGMEAEYIGKVTANIVTTHNENAMTLLSGSQLKGVHIHNLHKKAVFKAHDSRLEVKEIDNRGGLAAQGTSHLDVSISLTNHQGATLEASGRYKIGTFTNKAGIQKQKGAVFFGDGEFDSIDNAGSLETQGVTKINRRMNDNNTVSGFTNRSGAKAKLTKLEVGYGDTHFLTNSGYLDLIESDTDQGPQH